MKLNIYLSIYLAIYYLNHNTALNNDFMCYTILCEFPVLRAAISNKFTFTICTVSRGRSLIKSTTRTLHVYLHKLYSYQVVGSHREHNEYGLQKYTRNTIISICYTAVTKQLKYSASPFEQYGFTTPPPRPPPHPLFNRK